MTYYDILEVSPNASREVIEKAYRVLAKKYHPDINPIEQREQCEEYMKMINVAYDILIDDEKRNQYDESISAPSQDMYYTVIRVVRYWRKVLTISIVAYLLFYFGNYYILNYIGNTYTISEQTYNTIVRIYDIVANIITYYFGALIWMCTRRMTGKTWFPLIMGFIGMTSYGFYIATIYIYWKAHDLIGKASIMIKL